MGGAAAKPPPRPAVVPTAIGGGLAFAAQRSLHAVFRLAQLLGLDRVALRTRLELLAAGRARELVAVPGRGITVGVMTVAGLGAV
jgi:hypothetical protein